MGILNIMVIGMGSFGESLALELTELGHDVLGVDADANVVQRNAVVLTNAIQLDGTDREAMRTLDIHSFDVCIVGRGTDLEESALITLHLKELKARMIICKAMSDAQALILQRIGADQVIMPERDMGKRLAHMISTSTKTLDYMDVTGDYSIEEIVAPRGWLERELNDLQLPVRYGLQVLLVRSGEKFTTSPSGNTVIHGGDILVVFGHKRKLAQFKR